MNLITSFDNNEAIKYALSRIPKELHGKLGCDWFIGCDPIQYGLHDLEECTYGRSYRDTAHVMLPHNPTNYKIIMGKAPTVVIPELLKPEFIIHELGHVLDYHLGLQHRLTPVTWYAETNRQEAFAEAFTQWCFPESDRWERRLPEQDVALFERLKREV